MVHSIDGDARRRQLAEAVWRVIRRDGFEAASVRRVAEEAGLATGSVRHFFPTQNALHIFAMEALAEEVEARSTAAAASLPTARAAVGAMLAELLPLTDATHDDYLAHLHFTVRASVDPVLAPTARDGLGRLQQSYRGAVDALELAPGVDPADAAERLGILMDGLVLRLLTSPELLSRADARARLEAFLDDLTSDDRPRGSR